MSSGVVLFSMRVSKRAILRFFPKPVKNALALVERFEPFRCFAGVQVDFVTRPDGHTVEIYAEVENIDRTGVEMEAMTAASVAALTLYDMVKGMERGVRVERVELVEKSGGRSGHWRREEG